MKDCKMIAFRFLGMVLGIIALTTLYCGVATASPVKIVFVGYDGDHDGLYDFNIRMASCTHIGDGYYLTNNHVIAPEDTVRSEDWEITILDDETGERYLAKYDGTFAPFDLAIIESSHVASEAFTMRPDPYRSVSPYYINTWQYCDDGDPDLSCQYGEFDYVDVSGTVVSEWSDKDGRVSGVILTANVRPGNSGGAIVDSCGYLVGLVSAMQIETPNAREGPCITVSGNRFGKACAQIGEICERWKPPLYVWSSASCGACRRFEQDAFFSNNNFRALIEERYHLIKVDTDQTPLIRTHINPNLSIELLPTFVRGDNGRRLEGYTGMVDLLTFLGIDPKRLVENQPRDIPQPEPPEEVTPDEPPQYTPSTPPQEEPGPEPEQEPPQEVTPETTPEAPKPRPNNPRPTPEPERANFDIVGLLLEGVTVVAPLIGGGLATGGTGLLAYAGWHIVRNLVSRKKRRYTKPPTCNNPLPKVPPCKNEESEGCLDAPIPFPRELDEANQLLELAKAEYGGSAPVLDALTGRLFRDKVAYTMSDEKVSPECKRVIQELLSHVDQRINEIAPLTVVVEE